MTQTPVDMCIKNVRIAEKWLVDKTISRDEKIRIHLAVEDLTARIVAAVNGGKSDE